MWIVCKIFRLLLDCASCSALGNIIGTKIFFILIKLHSLAVSAALSGSRPEAAIALGISVNQTQRSAWKCLIVLLHNFALRWLEMCAYRASWGTRYSRTWPHVLPNAANNICCQPQALEVLSTHICCMRTSERKEKTNLNLKYILEWNAARDTV